MRQIAGSHLQPTEPETLGVTPWNLCLKASTNHKVIGSDCPGCRGGGLYLCKRTGPDCQPELSPLPSSSTCRPGNRGPRRNHVPKPHDWLVCFLGTFPSMKIKTAHDLERLQAAEPMHTYLA